MTPTIFPEANTKFRAPADLAESQCQTIPGYVGSIRGGSLDGSAVVVVAWMPDEKDLEDLKNGKPIYLSCIGGLPPHLIGMDFNAVTNPA